MENDQQTTRINKYLSQNGICSRREADKLIEEGLVTINGKKAKLGDQVSDKDQLTVKGRKIPKREIKKIYIAFHKPYGVITTTDRESPNNILEYVDVPERIYPVGRLDVQSSGLILLTNDGDIVNKLMRAENKQEKEYLVTVDKPFITEDLKKLERGIMLEGRRTMPAIIEKISPNQISITIMQGLNRQIRRMCEVLGFNVKILKRVRIAGILLGELARGKWRFLTEEELKSIK